MTLWALIAAVAVVTVLIKAAGPVVLGGRELPARVSSVIALMPPVLLAALVVTSTFADGRHLQVDASTAGVAVAGVLVWRRHSIVLAVVVAAGVTAAIRAIG
jgi:branched-subunit amino acid transport protein